jgi:hypothetical protein
MLGTYQWPHRGSAGRPIIELDRGKSSFDAVAILDD